MPTRIFAEALAALSLWKYGIKPAGIVGYLEGYEYPAEWDDVARFDLGAGELDIEKLIELAPDLSIGFTWDTTTKNDFGGVDESRWAGFTDIAPSVCILAVEVSIAASIERFDELAAALGADVDIPANVSEREAFLAASDAVRTAAAAKPGLRATAINPTPDNVYIGNPTVASDLIYFAELGVELIIPQAPDAYASGLFQEVSWEQINEYRVDLYLVDNRPSTMSLEALTAMPVFGFLEAVQAGQIAPWPVEYVTSYAGLTPTLVKLAESINNAEIVTG
ncbi:MAG: ABC transporter substrate-binding protein [Thermomicrobiales bacterium]